MFVAGPPAEAARGPRGAGSRSPRFPLGREVRPVPNHLQPPLLAPLFGLSFWLKKAGKNNTFHQILEQV